MKSQKMTDDELLEATIKLLNESINKGLFDYNYFKTLQSFFEDPNNRIINTFTKHKKPINNSGDIMTDLQNLVTEMVNDGKN